MYFLKLLDPHTKADFDESETTSIVQILMVWMLEKRYHSLFLNNLLSFFVNLLKNKLSSLLVLTLVRLNTIALINDCFFSICINGTLQKHTNIDELYVFIKDFVVRLNKYF